MTTDPKRRMMEQVRDRILDNIGSSGEIEGNKVIIEGVTEEEWSNEENKSLIMDEPGIYPEVHKEEETYTIEVDFGSYSDE